MTMADGHKFSLTAYGFQDALIPFLSPPFSQLGRSNYFELSALIPASVHPRINIAWKLLSRNNYFITFAQLQVLSNGGHTI